MVNWEANFAMNRAADWLKQAERDLKAAADSAAAGNHEWTAFQAQQCGEKAVQALVQSLHGAVRGHSVTGMLQQLSARIEVHPGVLEAARQLDKVYLTSRYPNGFDSGAPADYFSETSSRELMSHARQVLEFCRSQIH